MESSETPFIRSVELKRSLEGQQGYPFSVPAIASMGVLEFKSPIVFFVGENGSGKSTLLEALSVTIGSVSVGSDDLQRDPTLASARNLAKHLKVTRNRRPITNLFLRSEDFFGFTRRMIELRRELQREQQEFATNLHGYGRDLAVGAMRGQMSALDSRYGENPDAFSHGETLLKVLQARMVPDGLYLLDEPETPLSPMRQLALLLILKEMVSQGCQFIIATHSPILMALPVAQILAFDDGHIEPIDYRDTEHYTVTRAFLNDPDAYLRRL